jgi:hypothetical protein
MIFIIRHFCLKSGIYLKKYISKYLIKVYKELYCNIGVLFKAISAGTSIYYIDYLKEDTS